MRATQIIDNLKAQKDNKYHYANVYCAVVNGYEVDTSLDTYYAVFLNEVKEQNSNIQQPLINNINTAVYNLIQNKIDYSNLESVSKRQLSYAKTLFYTKINKTIIDQLGINKDNIDVKDIDKAFDIIMTNIDKIISGGNKALSTKNASEIINLCI